MKFAKILSLFFMLGLIGVSCQNQVTLDDDSVSLNFNTEICEFYADETFNLSYKYESIKSKTSDIAFEASIKDVIAISKDGLVSALKNVDASGTIKIYLKSAPGIYDEIPFILHKAIYIEKMSRESDTIIGLVGETIDCDINISPITSNRKDIVYQIDNLDVFDFDPKTYQLSFLSVGNGSLQIRPKINPNNVSITLNIVVKDPSYKSLVSLEEGEATRFLTYEGVKRSQYHDPLPSISLENQKTKVLVLPIEFSEYPFEENALQNLDIVFNGTSKVDLPFESVASYYEKSSFGKLNLEFDILNPYLVNSETFDIKTGVLTSGQIVDFAYKCINQEKENNLAFEDFDYDINGDFTYDAVWIIYSAPYRNKANELDDNFWAFVSNTGSRGSILGYEINNYGWASYDFIHQYSDEFLDAHTYIHETGHLLGLEDYYSYKLDCSPLGGFDMMDYNLGDHNAWSKAALGWINPIIYDASIDFNALVTLDKSSDKTALFITDKYQDTMFDEFLVLELYSNDGLNEYDSKNALRSDGKNLPLGFGVKMYHVDARLVTSGYNVNKKQTYFNNSNIKNFGIGSNRVQIGASNTPTNYTEIRNLTYESFNLISLISKDPKTGDYLHEFKPFELNDLFQTGDKFTMADYSKNFYKEQPFLNNGNELNIELNFEYVTEEKAEIKITHLNRI